MEVNVPLLLLFYLLVLHPFVWFGTIYADWQTCQDTITKPMLVIGIILGGPCIWVLGAGGFFALWFEMLRVRDGEKSIGTIMSESHIAEVRLRALSKLNAEEKAALGVRDEAA